MEGLLRLKNGERANSAKMKYIEIWEEKAQCVWFVMSNETPQTAENKEYQLEITHILSVARNFDLCFH